MQYAVLIHSEKENPLLNHLAFGQRMEMLMEQKGFYSELPTNADWGYVFRVQVKSVLVDISIVELSEYSFGIALEPVKSFFSLQFSRRRCEAVDFVKGVLIDILKTENRHFALTWYSDVEWRKAFGKGFWQQQD
jgi:hypothetical protein